MEEIWMYIESYGKLYKISNFGRVWSTRMDREMIPGIDGGGYKYVNLCDGGVKPYKVHRLVALHFIPLIEGKEIVNHIDENRQNNKVDNLEWCTQKENANHGMARQRLSKSKINSEKSKAVIEKKKKKIIGIEIKTGKEVRFNSIADASRNGFNRSAISRCINKHWNHHKDYKWFEDKEHNKKVLNEIKEC